MAFLILRPRILSPIHKWRFSGIREVRQAISDGEVSPVDLVTDQIRLIEELNTSLNAFITICKDEALKAASECEKSKENGKALGLLGGIPLSIKDNIYVKDVLCTAGSKILSLFVSDYDATCVAKMREHGGVIVGKNNLHEFASGVTSVNPFFGAVRNPWDTSRIAGGSSGGSAAAVASGMVFAALGTDTSGSVRIPASLCGVVGLKPTFGLVSNYGVVPLSKTLDHVGIIARSCADAGIVLQSIAGYDPLDSQSAKHDVGNYVIGDQSTPFIVGVPKHYFMDVLDEEVREAFLDFLEDLREAGISVVDVEMPDLDRVQDVWYSIRFSEAASFHKKWFTSRRHDYGPDVAEMLRRGGEVRASEYTSALVQRKDMERVFLSSLKDVDAVVTPTTPIVAPHIGRSEVELDGSTQSVYKVLTRCTLPFNVTGFPALTIPLTLSRDKMPIGVQIAGKPFDERLILQIGHRIEAVRGNLPIFL